MTRKKVLILGGALLTLMAATSAGAIFLGANVLSYVPFIGAVKGHTEAEPKELQDAETHEAQPARHESAKLAAEGEVVHAEAGAAKDEHGGSSKSGKDAKVELVPAPDYTAPQSRSSSAIRAIRDMNALQTQMAKGQKDAPQALKAVMLSVPDLFAEIEVSKIAPSEVQAVALFVLSGGNPKVVLRLLKSGSLPTEQQALLKGVMSFATADLVKASENLLPLDPKKFETTLGAQLSMAQAQLATGSTVEENINRLAFAADVAPGTLIEEAAIRRIIPHLVTAKDIKRLSYWAQRYLRRFPNSLYYQDFEVSLVNAIVTLLAGKSHLDETALAGMFRTAGEKRAALLARQILLRVILEGSTARCTLVEKPLAATFDLSLDSLKAAAALIKICKFTEGGVEELAELKSMDQSALDEDVRTHLSKAIAMAEAIYEDVLPQDDGRSGPYLPLSTDEAYAPLFASVAQQMDASLSAIRRVDDDETGFNK